MADLALLRESREILRQMGVAHKDEHLLCPVLRVLRMRHADLDIWQAKKVLRQVLS